jgi:Zn finger protein HypA/HybF involved in hydrogenase expression
MSENFLKNVVMYCVKCRHKVNVSSPNIVETKSNRKALKGKCPHCNTVTYKFVSNDFS